MDQDKVNLVNPEELESKSYEEIVEMEKEIMQNPEATHADLGVIAAEVVTRELKMGIFKGYDVNEVCRDIISGKIYEKIPRDALYSNTRISTNS